MSDETDIIHLLGELLIEAGYKISWPSRVHSKTIRVEFDTWSIALIWVVGETLCLRLERAPYHGNQRLWQSEGVFHWDFGSPDWHPDSILQILEDRK